MSASGLHLVFNHFPVFGTFFGCAVMACGYRLRNETVITVGLFTFMCVGISAVPVAFAGMVAEDAITDPLKKISVKAHALAGELTTYLSTSCGVTAYIAYSCRNEKRPSAGRITLVLFAGSIIAFAMMVWAGYTGGGINHR